MKKSITLMVVMLTFLALMIPLASVSASDVETVGYNRTVTLYTPEVNTNVTVVVPIMIGNYTDNNFMFTVIDESGVADDYLLNITIDVNGTLYTESVAVTSVADNTTVAYVNYTALTLPLNINGTSNITIDLVFDGNYTVADTWYGDIDIVNEQEYTMSVILMSLLMNLMYIAIFVSFMMLIIKYLKEAVEPTKGAKKK